MPNLASSTGPIPAISRPRKRTAPVLGRSRPVTTLTSVVLPAPLGPTIETNSPSWTRSETLLRALNAPKVLQTLTVSNSGAGSAKDAGCMSSPSMAPVDDCLDGARQALRHEHHEKHQHAAHHKAPVLRDRHHEILQYHEGQRADRGACEGSAAAEHRHEHQIAGMVPISQFGSGRARGDRQDGPADAAIDRRDHERGQPHA